MTQYKTIEQLNNELKDNEDNKALGIINKVQYYAIKKRIEREIEKVDTRPSCTFSADPTPDQSKLKAVKDWCFEQVEPYKNRIGIPQFNGILVSLKFCTTIAEVQTLYERWKSKLHHKQIAELPDFPLPQKAAA